jgi:hypothetical protein
MSEPDEPNMPSIGVVENEVVVRSKTRKRATKVPRARCVQAARKGAS